jgi:hypothetical protein
MPPFETDNAAAVGDHDGDYVIDVSLESVVQTDELPPCLVTSIVIMTPHNHHLLFVFWSSCIYIYIIDCDTSTTVIIGIQAKEIARSLGRLCRCIHRFSCLQWYPRVQVR